MIFSIDNLNHRINNYQENYEYSCGEGFTQQCVEEGKRGIEIGEDETYQICDTDRKEYAVCVPEDYRLWRICEIGQTAWCIDNNRDWTSCDIGKDAICQ